MSSQSKEENQQVLQTHLQAVKEQFERIERRMAALATHYRERLIGLQTHQPGYFVSRKVRDQWWADLENEQERILTLTLRLNRLTVLRERTTEFVEERLRTSERKLAEAGGLPVMAPQSEQQL